MWAPLRVHDDSVHRRSNTILRRWSIPLCNRPLLDDPPGLCREYGRQRPHFWSLLRHCPPPYPCFLAYRFETAVHHVFAGRWTRWLVRDERGTLNGSTSWGNAGNPECWRCVVRVAGSILRNPLQTRTTKTNHHTSQQQSLDDLRLTQAVPTKTSPLRRSQTFGHYHDLASLPASPKPVQHCIQKSKIDIYEAAAGQTFYTGWRQQRVVAQGKGSRKD